MKAQVLKLSLSTGTELLFSNLSPLTCAFRVHNSLKVRKTRPEAGRKKIQKLICTCKPLKCQVISKTLVLMYSKTDFFHILPSEYTVGQPRENT